MDRAARFGTDEQRARPHDNAHSFPVGDEMGIDRSSDQSYEPRPCGGKFEADERTSDTDAGAVPQGIGVCEGAVPHDVHCGYLSWAPRQRAGWLAMGRLRLGRSPRNDSAWGRDRKSGRSEDAPLQKIDPIGPSSGVVVVVIPTRSVSEPMAIPQYAYREAVVALGDPEKSLSSGRYQGGAGTNRLAHVQAYLLDDAARVEG